MISLKESMAVLDEADRKVRLASRACASVVQWLQRTLQVLGGTLSSNLRERLEWLQGQLEGPGNIDAIETVAGQLPQEIDQLIEDIALSNEQKEREYKALIRVLADAAETFSRNGTEKSSELKQFAQRIEEARLLESIVTIRTQLAARVSELKSLAREIDDSGQRQAMHLQSQIQAINERLKQAEEMAETDPLTGLGNRRHAEKFMRAAIQSGRTFSLVLFDLDKFKQVNDRHGHNEGDRLLQTVARNLRDSIRRGDTVCRWGGDEFAVFLRDCTATQARGFADRISAGAFGEFLGGATDNPVRFKVGASAGVAEYAPGESAEDFFRRADEQLYAQKRARR